jgi:hydrogenase small subunit
MGATLAAPVALSPTVAGALGTPAATLPAINSAQELLTDKIVTALSTAAFRPPLVWLEFQGCTGDSESLLRSGQPTVAQILLEILSVNYHETLMVPSGKLATQSLTDTISQYPGKYLCVVEGSIPTGAQEYYCTIGGRSALKIAREATSHAAATISVGSCSSSGGLAAAAPNPTNAKGVQDAVGGIKNFVSLPGCPMNVTNLAALIVYYLTNSALPPLDAESRPTFAYGLKVHDKCFRRPRYDAGQFALDWSDPNVANGWCLFQLGCRGPYTSSNCPTVKWNDGTNWPVGAGHPCIGCTSKGFWDTESPFYVA